MFGYSPLARSVGQWVIGRDIKQGVGYKTVLSPQGAFSLTRLIYRDSEPNMYMKSPNVSVVQPNVA